MNPLLTAIIGVGQQGMKRLRAVLRLRDDFHLVRLVDRDGCALQRAQAEVAKGGGHVAASANWQDVVEDRNINSVIIATSTMDHEAAAMACLQRGLHVLVEKPLGPSLMSAQRIVAAARLSPSILKVGLNYPYRPTARAALAIFREGLIGRLVHARATIGHGQFVGTSDARTRDFLQQGSSLEDLGIHAIDLGLAIFDEDLRVAAALITTRQVFEAFPVEEIAVANFTTNDGRVFSVTSSFVEHRPWMGLRFELLGRGGRLVFSMAPNSVERMIRHPSNLAGDSPVERCAEHTRHVVEALQKHGVPAPQPAPVANLLHRSAPEVFYSDYRLDFGTDDPSLDDELHDFAVHVRGGEPSGSYRDAYDCLRAQRLIAAARVLAAASTFPVEKDGNPQTYSGVPGETSLLDLPEGASAPAASSFNRAAVWRVECRFMPAPSAAG